MVIKFCLRTLSSGLIAEFVDPYYSKLRRALLDVLFVEESHYPITVPSYVPFLSKHTEPPVQDNI